MDAVIIFGAKYLVGGLVFLAALFFVKQSGEKRKQLAIFAIVALPIIYVAAKIGSLLYYDPRPFVVENFAPLIAHANDNGFPSDHTLLSAAVAAVVYFFNKKVGALLMVLALLIGAARVLAGVHHTLDIIGSVIIASSISFFVYRFIFPIVVKSRFLKGTLKK